MIKMPETQSIDEALRDLDDQVGHYSGVIDGIRPETGKTDYTIGEIVLMQIIDFEEKSESKRSDCHARWTETKNHLEELATVVDDNEGELFLIYNEESKEFTVGRVKAKFTEDEAVPPNNTSPKKCLRLAYNDFYLRGGHRGNWDLGKPFIDFQIGVDFVVEGKMNKREKFGFRSSDNWSPWEYYGYHARHGTEQNLGMPGYNIITGPESEEGNYDNNLVLGTERVKEVLQEQYGQYPRSLRRLEKKIQKYMPEFRLNLQRNLAA